MDDGLSILADGVAGVLLLWVIAEDARHYRIHNVAVVVLAGLSGTSILAGSGLTDLAWHAVFGAVVLGAMAGAFALRLVGAGDAKLLAAACFRVGASGAVVFAGALLALSAAYGLGAVLGWLPARRTAGGLSIPFAPSIAGAWLVAIAILRVG